MACHVHFAGHGFVAGHSPSHSTTPDPVETCWEMELLYRPDIVISRPTILLGDGGSVHRAETCSNIQRKIHTPPIPPHLHWLHTPSPYFTLHSLTFTLHPLTFTLHSLTFTLHPLTFTLHSLTFTLHPLTFTFHREVPCTNTKVLNYSPP